MTTPAKPKNGKVTTRNAKLIPNRPTREVALFLAGNDTSRLQFNRDGSITILNPGVKARHGR